MQIIPHPRWTMCECSRNVATADYFGQLLCAECARLRHAQDMARCASIQLEDPHERDLDSLLERLVRS